MRDQDFEPNSAVSSYITTICEPARPLHRSAGYDCWVRRRNTQDQLDDVIGDTHWICCHIATSEDQVSVAFALQGGKEYLPLDLFLRQPSRVAAASCRLFVRLLLLRVIIPSTLGSIGWAKGTTLQGGYTSHGITYATKLRESCGTCTSLNSRRDACIWRLDEAVPRALRVDQVRVLRALELAAMAGTVRCSCKPARFST